MSLLLWLAVGVLLALVAWLLAQTIVFALAMLALTLLAILVPREVTAAGAKVAIGFGAFYALVFGRLMIPNPLEASGPTYLVVLGGLLIVVAGVAGVMRNRRRRKRLARIKAAEVVLS